MAVPQQTLWVKIFSMPRKKRQKRKTAFTENFSKVLRDRKLSLKRAAEILGLPYTTVVGFANGAQPNDLEAISKFCTTLAIDFEWLLTGRVKNFDPSQIPLDQIFAEDTEASFSGIYKIEAKKLSIKINKEEGKK